ncbi:MAG: hypothetical protein Q8S21_04240 [Candidatus Paracaedibacteraceae bacterium]|nr:hypothetical protein [Candidatus Paracaedibacteraceae bacterium]
MTELLQPIKQNVMPVLATQKLNHGHNKEITASNLDTKTKNLT